MQNIQFGAARASRLGDQVAAHSGGSRSLPVATTGYHFGCFQGRSSGRR
jgi:hypothetical protein